jgi:cytochrome c-type biogenesis protein CcmH/NrfG
MAATVLFAHDRDAARAAVRRFARRLRTQDDADAWHALGAALISLGDRGGAIMAFRNALRLDDSRVHSQLALGNLLFDSGQCERALSCFGLAQGPR